ncbi:hypothetical protein, conserved in T. vivax [Trypanosoma vivax Y486]|uniref:Uncharacterized protein n=1 Tax=Trypanosoma vivax (strain Y486) TaxID=1055687 RepID=F9WLG3_TRYVY|nr:hypothetical protein, conserved in T. vivax [Trypanosoma vivax Y486]|eukprot:CCD18354.1 hypothetical protein, conserved in T. vivax [Trypanosoma vivax Y486]
MVTHMCTAFATAGSWALRSISHYVSILTQFHKEGKARWSLLESALGRAEADAKKKADGLADGEDRKAIQVECDEAVEETREAGRLLAETIYLLAKEGSDLHCAHKCARDFVEDDSKCRRRTASLALPAAKNSVEEGMQKYGEEESSHSCVTVFKRVVPSLEAAAEEEGATIKAVHGAVASFDGTGRET